MTISDVHAALAGKSERTKLLIIKEQRNIWVKGAGWKDVRTPFQRGNMKFDSGYLLEKLKFILQKYVQVDEPRAVRAAVPRPSQLTCARPMPTLGDTLSDALHYKELALEEEQKRLNDLHDAAGIPRRLEEMPDFDSLVDKKIAMLWVDEEEDEDAEQGSVMMWYFGTVASISNGSNDDDNKSCEVEIAWEMGGDKTYELLNESRWAGPNNVLQEYSWMLSE